MLGIVLVGDGVERERIERMAQEMALTCVAFHSSVEKAVVPWILSHTHAGLMQADPANYFKYGLSPNKLFDYFAAGKPVLISSEVPAIVDEVNAGIRYRSGDPDAVAEAVIRMVRHRASDLRANGHPRNWACTAAITSRGDIRSR